MKELLEQHKSKRVTVVTKKPDGQNYYSDGVITKLTDEGLELTNSDKIKIIPYSEVVRVEVANGE